MDIVVLVKAVPNPSGTPEIGDGHRLVRDGVELALDPGDEYGVELGLQLAEASGGEVTFVSMGPAGAVAALRKALSMGGSRAVLVTDPALAGADVLVTARVLAKAIARAPFDVVIAGVESTDGYTGTLPMALAEFLGVPNASFARKVEAADGGLRVERQTPDGYDVLECALPAVVTVTTAVAAPRYPTLKGIMGAKQKPMEQLSLSDLGLDVAEAAATQSVEAIEPAPGRQAGQVIQDDGQAASRIADYLAEAKVI